MHCIACGPLLGFDTSIKHYQSLIRCNWNGSCKNHLELPLETIDLLYLHEMEIGWRERPARQPIFVRGYNPTLTQCNCPIVSDLFAVAQKFASINEQTNYRSTALINFQVNLSDVNLTNIFRFIKIKKHVENKPHPRHSVINRFFIPRQGFNAKICQ